MVLCSLKYFVYRELAVRGERGQVMVVFRSSAFSHGQT